MSAFDLVVLSPHLDDAALSCGGLIHQEARLGRRVLVLTTFTGDIPEGPLSELGSWVLKVMKLEQATAMASRRAEDRRACACLNAELEHWPFFETPYRKSAAGATIYPKVEMLFGEPLPADEPLLDKLVERLGTLPPARRVLAPLAVGSHVDHHLLRRAADQVFGEQLELYEDFPYVRKLGALGKALGERRRWHSRVEKLTQADLEAKIAAVNAYESQVTPLFGSTRKMRRALAWRRFVIGGERFWRRSSIER